MSIGQVHNEHLNDLINKRLSCKNKDEQTKLNAKIVDTKHHVSNILNPKQAYLLLSLVNKYDIKPLLAKKNDINNPSQNYEYQLYLLDFEIKTIADDIVIPHMKDSKFDDKLVRGSHSANAELGSTINDESKSLKPNYLYTYHNNALNLATIDDIQKELKQTLKVLQLYLKHSK